MTLRKLLKILVGLLIIFAVVIGLTSINHPIIIKWLTGSARHIGKPINAKVYTNGKVNNDIKVFHVDKYWGGGNANTYLLSLSKFDTFGMLKFISINLNENWIGRPVGTSKDCYDFIGGHLFQSDIGGHFVPFDDPWKGFDFDPQLVFSEGQINLNVPPSKLQFDNVRIELQKE